MDTLRYMLDTEFIDDGVVIHPISVGIVCEDGREFYGELHDDRIPWDLADQWVLDNVKPLLHRNLPTTYTSTYGLACAIEAFVAERPEPPQFWAYYADWDWVVFCHLFGKMVEAPSGWPMLCMDLKQWAVMMGDPKLPEQHGTQHDALEDARWNWKVWNFLNLHSKGTGWKT